MKAVIFSICTSRWLSLAGLAVGAVTASPVAAQQPSQGGNYQSYSPTPSGGFRESVKNYALGPGDVLSIIVQGFPEYSAENMVVPPDGRIIMPVLGQFDAGGKTTAKLQAEMRARLGKRMRDPSRLTVSIRTLRDASSGYVAVLGKVRQPGQVAIRKGWRLTEVLSAVGGLNGRDDEMSLKLARANQLPLLFDLHQVTSHPNNAKINVVVKAGDLLVIETDKLGSISINGDVNKPGLYELRRVPTANENELAENARLLDAIVAAGGLTQNPRAADTGVPERLTGYIMRRGQRVELRVDDAMQYRDPEANVSLRAGDFLTITRQLPLNIYVNGLVNKPGSISVNPGSGVVEAITQAGGITTPLEKVKATILRGNTVLPVDLNQALLMGDSTANIKLMAGDIVQLNEPDVILVQVTGQVRKPTSDEPLRLPRNSRLLEALNQAGGVQPPSTEARIAVLRTLKDGGQRVLNIDPVALIEKNDISQNAILQDGDLVSVTGVLTHKVIVSGEVSKPGPVELRETDGLASLIVQAGGPTRKALLSQVIVQRNSKDFHIDTYDALKTGKPLDFKLEDGDYIVVPENKERVTILEAVNMPGEYAIPEREKLTVVQALNLAGGTRAGAKTKEILLLRPTKAGQPERKVIPLNNIGKSNTSFEASQTEVKPGDYIVVPENSVTPSFTQRALQGLSIFGAFRGFF